MREQHCCPRGWSLKLSAAHACVIRRNDSRISLREEVMPSYFCGILVFLCCTTKYCRYKCRYPMITEYHTHSISIKNLWFHIWLQSSLLPVLCKAASAPLKICEITDHCWGPRAKTSVQTEQRWQPRCPRGSREPGNRRMFLSGLWQK